MSPRARRRPNMLDGKRCQATLVVALAGERGVQIGRPKGVAHTAGKCSTMPGAVTSKVITLVDASILSDWPSD
jgi:hypothetical protein